MSPPHFRLKVQKIDQVCLFELSWGQGQQLSAMLNYPTTLTERYQDWQRIYLRFYSTVEMPLLPADVFPEKPGLRGRSIAGGKLSPSAIDWHNKLVEAELKLLNAFHHWLRSAELFEIRAAMVRGTHTVATTAHPKGAIAPSSHTLDQSITVFLTCIPLELARFPWEAWEIGADFAATGTIRLVRIPAIVTEETATRHTQSQRNRARILAILGDDTGLNFQTDMNAVQSLSRMADVTFVGWQPGQTAADVKTQIYRAIADPLGWDILFFAGHSNETEITGGELAIAPGVAISIHDISAPLKTAKERGLQVAIFNSCSGLNIAESLINLGFSQVAVMREPVHNRVAQEFLVQFLRGLASYQDVHAALLSACRLLRFEKNLTYPSAYLVPSLFCHPNATLFRIAPFGWKQRLQQSLPTRLELVTLTVGLLLSVLSPLQSALLDSRLWAQAVYRDYTGQIPAIAPPPVTLVQIDTASINRDGIAQISPIDRTYLARLIDRLIGMKAQIIGIDFVLDTPQPGDATLHEVMKRATQQSGAWVVFGAVLDDSGEIGVSNAAQITNLSWSLQGYIDADPNYVMLPYPDEDCHQTCPFAYLLSLLHTARQFPGIAHVSFNRQLNLRSQLLTAIDAEPDQHLPLTELRQLHLNPISVWAYETWGQHWLEPIIDFSIPADRIYRRISAWQIFHPQPSNELDQLSHQIVIIAPGSDERMGIAPGSPDRFVAPSALRYWQGQQYWLTGSESLAYMIYHQLNQRLVIPIPDTWMVAIAALVSKGIVLILKRQRNLQQWTRSQQLRHTMGLFGITAFYGLVGLQLYISAALLIPWLLPSAIVWIYTLPLLKPIPNPKSR